MQENSIEKKDRLGLVSIERARFMVLQSAETRVAL